MSAVIPLLLCLGSISVGAEQDPVIFSDDFSTLDPAWGNADAAKYVEEGKLVLKPSATRTSITRYQGSTFNDVDIRVRILQTDGATGGSAGIVFWGDNAMSEHVKSEYYAELRPDGGFAVSRYEEGKWLYPVPATVPNGVKKGLNQANELRVVAKGRRATIYVNDTQVAAFNGFPPDGGAIVGLFAQSGAQPDTWRFSDFVVRKSP